MDTIPFPDSLDTFQTADDAGEYATNDGSTEEHDRRPSAGILSKLPFLRTSMDETLASTDKAHLSPPGGDRPSSKNPSRAMAVAIEQQRTRRRKGSLRKAALLGRGAQRDRKEIRTYPLENDLRGYGMDGTPDHTSHEEPLPPAFGLGISNETSRPPIEERPSRSSNIPAAITTLPMGLDYQVFTSSTQATSPTLTYTSTTDEEDILSMPSHKLSGSSGSGQYIPSGFLRHRSFQKPKSPLSIGGLAASSLPVQDGEWDYSQTEWWGWVVLIVTWVVFVTGMGSCLGVWSWAWDVGETPYAPPELEDDPTLPIVGYYPALIILTAVMAWVWVVVAWVGMKYFRHAKISGD